MSFAVCFRPAPTTTPASTLLLPRTQTANISMKEKKRRMKQDPWGWAQAQARKNAHLEKRAKIEEQRQAELGDPVHGITTPFVESLDTAGQEPVSPATGQPLPTSPHIKNYLLSQEEVEKAIEYSQKVTAPLIGQENAVSDPAMEKEALEEHQKKHEKAMIALQRITDLKNGSAKDRKHANIRRCIETFGRHVTDKFLQPAPRGPAQGEPKPKPPRAGPDTGSSEVQIAILTAKIRALAKALEGYKGYKDKNNKRSLRKLLHKRQRLLRYMERKERGSERWQYMVKMLGITPACYKGQISI